MSNSQELQEMKSWLLECFEDEHDQEQIEELSYTQCVRAINRHYDGGIRAFRECLNWTTVEV